MTKFEFSLPDSLALEAQQAGVLTQDRVEHWVRQEVREQKLQRLFAAVERASDGKTEYVPPEEVAQEVHAMRAERRTRQ